MALTSFYNSSKLLHTNHPTSRSRYPCALRRASAATFLQVLRVRVPPVALLSISGECCMSSGRGLCDGPITHPEETNRACICVCVCVSLNVIRCKINPLHLHWVGREDKTKNKRKNERKTLKKLGFFSTLQFAHFNPSAWGHLNPSSYCDVGRLFYGVFKLWSKLQRKKWRNNF